MLNTPCLCSASGSSIPDIELVDEVLKYIPEHEEDYLDVTLDEEGELLGRIKSFLDKSSVHSR